ncbi:hypothetical protein JOM56_006532 [Amanita muscaria]
MNLTESSVSDDYSSVDQTMHAGDSSNHLIQLQDTTVHASSTEREHSFTNLVPITTPTNDPYSRIYIPPKQSSLFPRAQPNSSYQLASQLSSTCVGYQLDASADGLIIVAAISCVFGLLIWWLFSILRPRLRSIYALRVWFAHPDLRPKSLPSSLFAFLRPKLPLFPSFPTDVSRTGRSVAEDARLFPSDEQLSQRFLWVAFLVASYWSVIGLGGALPIYIINVPCSFVKATGFFGGNTSILLELSILSLLHMFDASYFSFKSLPPLVADAVYDPQHTRIRLIVITGLLLVVGLLPAIYLVLREFNNVVEHRRRWVELKCQGNELGWLSASRAPGFVGWGEQKLKKFIISSGLSSSLDTADHSNGFQSKRRRGSRRRRLNGTILSYVEEANLEVDIQMLFSIGDTQHLARLIDERDAILENLEIAESKYITSFRITTPDPSVLDLELPVPPPNPERPYISLPRPLGTQKRYPRGRRVVNRALASSSLAPISFVAPSQYYKLRNIHAFSTQSVDSRTDEKGRAIPRRRALEPSFSDAFNSRITGSRFFEVSRNSGVFGRVAPLAVDESGQLILSAMPDNYSGTIPDPRLHGPNYVPETDSWDERFAQQLGAQRESYAAVTTETDGNLSDGWVDIATTAPVNFGDDYCQQPEAGPSNSASAALLTRRPRPSKQLPPLPQSQRETFPLRQKEQSEPVPPPHMRLQPSQPYVRPLDGINFNELGGVYTDITHWRSSLKSINAEIEELQRDSYNDIADGARIKGWLVVGKGLHYIPGMELIEGRAKEDIRWDVLQNEPVSLDATVLWGLMSVIVVLLVVGLTAASGLSLATAPNIAYFLSFLKPLLNSNLVLSGIATVLAPAAFIIIFLFLALAVVDWAIFVYGFITISAHQLFLMKISFFLSAMVTVGLIVATAFLSSIPAFTFKEATAISLADGSIASGILLLAIVTTITIIFPGLLLLQPVHLWRVTQAQRDAITPRQRFRALYPLTYNPSFSLGACIFGLISASTFWLIFPLIGPVVALLLFLSLVAHRYTVGYVYARTHSQTGGLLQIWLLKCFGTILFLQPAFLGLIFLSRRLWIEGGVLLGTAVALTLLVEVYTSQKTRIRRSPLSAFTQDSLSRFTEAATGGDRANLDEQDTLDPGTPKMRGSMASVFDMMSITLAVTPAQFQGPVPLRTETIDDLTATETAARTHPDAPPHLPALSFTEHADDMAGVLYAPELIAPQPIIWLPNDPAGVARSEAAELRKYHDLHATIDVCETKASNRKRASSSHR